MWILTLDAGTGRVEYVTGFSNTWAVPTLSPEKTKAKQFNSRADAVVYAYQYCDAYNWNAQSV